MDYRLVDSVAAFEALESQWNALLAESATHVPFLRHEYLRIWWDTLGGGEWPDGQLAIVTGWDGDELAGIAPLFATRNLDGQPALMFLGSIEISDYLDVIARPQHLEAFIAGLLDFVQGLDSIDWDVLDLYNFPQESPSLQVFRKAADGRGMAVEQTGMQPAPAIPLPGDWETYLASLDKKQRHEIRRKMRRIEGEDQTARWYIVDDRSTLEGEIEAFLEVMALDPAKDKFLNPAMRRQMFRTMQTAFEAGWLQLAFLEINGQKAACYINFDFENRIWVYNSGLNFEFSPLSPGWVLLSYLIQWAIENGRTSFDFMRGEEDYKLKFGGVPQHVQRLIIQRAAPSAASMPDGGSRNASLS